MEYRIFIHYNTQDMTDSVEWFEKYLKENLSNKGAKWWCQDVTDYWDYNTRCYYFRNQADADKFRFVYKMTRNEKVYE
tara:strand:- start:959 stop:1192 length:234 start_codon:yes stop_codon:yes gene_type:complete